MSGATAADAEHIARFGLPASSVTDPPRLAAMRLLSAALDAVDPAQAVQRALRRDGRWLRVHETEIDLHKLRRVLVLGAGKAGAPMCQALESILGDRISAGWVNVKQGHTGPTSVIHLHEAGHPIPDDSGVFGTRAIVDLLQHVTAEDLILCPISGGGSALLTLPIDGITLADLQQTTDLLLRAGATINELNAVRTVLDRVKGGGLAELAGSAHVVTLVLSDVIGDPLDVIASGPTVPPRGGVAEAHAVVDRYALWSHLPASVARAIRTPGRHSAPATAPGPRTVALVGSNRQAAQAALLAAEREGYSTLDLGSYLQGEAREVGRVLGCLARSMATEQRPLGRPACIVAGGETTVTVRGPGRGGRNQELALGAALEIAELPSVLVVSLGTDGTDGPTDAAGALADGTTVARARAAGLNPYHALAANDSYAFFDRLGDLLRTGPTQTNVNDLMLVLVA